MGRDRLSEANSALWGGETAVRIAGTAMAGTLIAVTSASGALALDALSFLASALLIRGIVYTPAHLGDGTGDRPGLIASIHRPWDHRWHKGLQLTWSHLSGDNFWGGPTFEQGAPGHGYVWRENHGVQRHDSFEVLDTEGSEVTVRERLDWIASTGRKWIDETRTLRFHSADPARGIWALDFATELTNVHTEPLRLGSPTTHGRPNAGYTGLFWRGPRSWTGADIIAAEGDGEAVMGTQTAWVAISGEHDGIDGGATVIAYAGTSSSQVPVKWFARSGPFAALNPSPAFDTEITLDPGGTLRLRHRFVFVDQATDRSTLEPIASEFAL